MDSNVKDAPKNYIGVAVNHAGNLVSNHTSGVKASIAEVGQWAADHMTKHQNTGSVLVMAKVGTYERQNSPIKFTAIDGLAPVPAEPPMGNGASAIERAKNLGYSFDDPEKDDLRDGIHVD